MGYFNTQIITDDGLAIMSRGISGESRVVFTRMKTGSGEYSIKEIADLKKTVSLKSEMQQFDISSIRTEDETIRIKAVISNENLEESYFIREVGVYAKENDGEEKLVAISICNDNPTLLQKYDDIPIQIPITNFIAHSGDGNFEIVYSSDVYATAEELHEEVERAKAAEKANADAISAEVSRAKQAENTNANNLTSHTENKYNPHGVTKSQVGLGNVDNTSDTNKPVSTAQQDAIDAAYANSNAYTDEKIAQLINGAPSTMDTLKEIADAMEEHESVVEALDEAIGSKANESEFNSHVTNKNNPHGVTKSDIGLGNVDNTSDAEKFVKYAESATNSKFLDGFTVQSSSEWGVQTGEYVHGEETNDGCAFKFNKNCPSSGKLSMLIDGNFYQNEGNYMCLDTNNYSSYALPLSGGTMTGAIKRSGNAVVNTGTDGSTNFSGGTTLSDGASLVLRGSTQSGIEGRFELCARDASTSAALTGKPDGTLQWGGKLLHLSHSDPKINLNGMYFYRDGGSNHSTHIYGNTSSYPHLWLRQFSNVFQFFPNTTYASGTKEVNIGHSSYRFGDGYFTNLYNSSGMITTSDKNKKHDIEEISDDFSEKIVDGLIPSSFKFNDGSSGRTHFGIIAQDLEKLLESLGISNTDFAPLVKEYPDKEVEIENPDYDETDENSQKYIKKLEKDYDAEPIYNVRYEEFIMILVKYCQGLKKKDLGLEKRMSELEERLCKLEENQ